LRAAEDVDHVHRLGNVGELGINLLAEDLLARLPRIDRDHVIAPIEQVFERKIARPVFLRRDSDHGDGLYGVEDAADVAVRIGIVVHPGEFTFSLACASSVRNRWFSASSAAIFSWMAPTACSISASEKRATMCEEQFESQASIVKRMTRSGFAL